MMRVCTVIGLTVTLAPSAEAKDADALSQAPIAASEDHSSARVALFFLSAAAAGTKSTPPSEFVISGVERPLDLVTAAGILDRMVKPLSCQGAVRGSLLKVDCHPIVDSSLMSFHFRQAQTFISSLREIRSPANGTAESEGRLISLRNDFGQSLVVSSPIIESFFRDYDVHFVCSLNRSDPLEMGEGVVAVMSIAPPIGLRGRGLGFTFFTDST